MSVLRPLLSRRGKLVFVATALLLIGTLVAEPNASGAKAAVKQFLATITPITASSWTEQVTNCGGTPLQAPCTASSTIGLGTIRIAVPATFRPSGATVTVSISAPTGRNWTVSYDSATGNITAAAVTGSDKLQPGESVSITIISSATPSTSCTGTNTFTTAAWGSATVPGTEPFTLKGSQPSVGCTVTGPDEQTETLSGDFQGHVDITFDGDTVIDCSFDPQFGTQWLQFRLPHQVNIIPAGDFVAGSSPKISTSTFPATGADSSSYLICWAVPTAGHTAFATRGGGTATMQTIGGTNFFVGILPNCYNPTTGGTRPEPCVSEQFKDLATNKIVISVRMPPNDPHKR